MTPEEMRELCLTAQKDAKSHGGATNMADLAAVLYAMTAEICDRLDTIIFDLGNRPTR